MTQQPGTFEKYKKARNEYGRIRREYKIYEKTLWKRQKKSKTFMTLLRSRLLVKEQIIRLKDSVGRVVETEEKIYELNAKFRSFFIVEDKVPTTLERWEVGRDYRC